MRNLIMTLKPKYAISFIFRFLIIMLVGTGIFGSLVIIFLNRKIGPTYLEGISTLSQLRASLPHILFATAFVQALALCIITALLALFWSRSIAGPLVRFRKYLRGLSQGKSLKEPVAFRESDQLQGLAQVFSEMITAHRDNSVKALALLVQAQRIIDECEVLKKQPGFDMHKFNSKLKELEKIYLNIKNIYTAK